MSTHENLSKPDGYRPIQVTRDAAKAIGFTTQICIYCEQTGGHPIGRCPTLEASKRRRFELGELKFEPTYGDYLVEDPDALEPCRSREERQDDNIIEFDIEDRKYERLAKRKEKEQKRAQVAEQDRVVKEIAEAMGSNIGGSVSSNAGNSKR